MADIVISGAPPPQPSGATPTTPPPVKPAPLIPAVKPVTITMVVDAHDVINATVGQMETTASTLLSEALKEAVALAIAALDPLVEKYIAQLEAALPALIKAAVHHLWVEDPEEHERMKMGTVPAGLLAEVEKLLADAEKVTAAVESLGDLPGVDKIVKYVVDVDKVLHIVSAFLQSVAKEV